MPLLYPQLNTLRPGVVPEAVLRQLRDDFHQNAIRNLFLTGELVRLLDVLNSNGIIAVPYKGPTLAVLARETLPSPIR